MIKFKLLALLIILGLIICSYRCFGDGIHSRSVVIDTDMGLDDARALSWLFGMHDIHIEGIISSDGALDPSYALKNLRIMLTYYDKPEIPICEGIHLGEPDPPFRKFVTEAFSSFPEPASNFKLQKKRIFYEILTDSIEDHSLIYVCLGPFSNLAYAIDSIPGFTNKLKRVIYAGNSPDQNRMAWNTSRDKSAADKVFSSLPEVYEFDITGGSDDFFEDSIVQTVMHSANKVASFYRIIHNLDTMSGNSKPHLFLYDDIIPLYLQFPELFTLASTTTGKSLKDFKKEILQSCYSDFLESGKILSPRPNVIFKQYPIDTSFFRKDVAGYSREIIIKHGLEEWKAAILANEMHRHLGAYSIAGVKMGILAREILGADIDELSVVSFGGKDPPLSCLTDGLQIATGASLGRGTIRNSANSVPYPKALFIKDSREILIELKPEIINNIESNIVRLTNQFGYGTSRYFEEIRKISIQYWINLNRKHMFDVYDNNTDEK